MSSEGNQFTVYAGRHNVLELLVVDEDGNPVDLTDSLLEFGAEDSGAPSGTDDTISKTSADGGIEILDQVTNRGRCNVTIGPDDADPAHDQVLDCELIGIDLGGTAERLLAGRLTVIRRVI